MVAVTGITVSPSQYSRNQEEGAAPLQLRATVTPSNATNKKVRWTSSNEQVAKVDANGRVTFVKLKTGDPYLQNYINPGTAIITATTEDGGKTATCEITILVQVN